MNRACDNCGRIITVPDIPLPDGYTQKCTYCGHNNPVSDEPPAPDLADWDTLDTTSGSMFPTIAQPSRSTAHEAAPAENLSADMIRKDLVREFEERLRDLETRMRAEIKETAVASGEAPSPFKTEVQKHVNEKTALIGCSQAVMAKSCRQALTKEGFQVEVATSLDVAANAIVKTPFHVMVLDQSFLQSGSTGKQILRYIKRTPLEVRRCQAVILITPSVASGEPQVFYQWALDLNIHPRDLSGLAKTVNGLLSFKEDLLSDYLAG